MTKQTQARMLSVDMVRQALNNPEFYKAMPEFIPLRTKYNNVNKQIKPTGGCGGCRKRRLVTNVFREFVNVTGALDDNGKQRLRGYFGGSVIMQRQNPKTKRVVTITI